MKLQTVRIENFRAFKDQTIELDDYSCFVGPNGSGKSTVLVALNIFFRNSASAVTDLLNLSEEDFHLRDTKAPICITLCFGALTEGAKEDLKAYVRQDKLIVSARAVWDPNTSRAEVVQYGSRLVMRDFVPFFKAQERKAKADELRAVFGQISEKLPEIGKAGTIDAMRATLREFEESHPDKCELVEAATQFYGWTRGDNHLRRHLQWVYLPAVKDPTTEQDEGRTTALGQLLERTIRQKVKFDDSLEKIRKEAADRYKSMLAGEQGVLDALTRSLTEKLKLWAHENARAELRWHYNDSTSIKIAEPLARIFAGENQFLGELGRLGHGLQRSFLVALLQELSEADAGKEGTLVLGFEEPELYQHPPQARHMAAILESLSTSTAQIVVTTHSPYFISGKGFESVRMTRTDAKTQASQITQLTHKALSDKLAKALGDAPQSPTSMMASVEQIMLPSQSELFFSKVPILVEGVEDVAFLTTHLKLTNRWEKFRRLGCHFVVADGKGKLSRPLAIADGLGIPAFAIFDADSKNDSDGNRKDNRCIFSLCGQQEQEPLPKDIVWGKRSIAWPDDIKSSVVGELGQAQWDKANNDVRKKYGFEHVTQKNTIILAAIVETLWGEGLKSKTLEMACATILQYAELQEGEGLKDD